MRGNEANGRETPSHEFVEGKNLLSLANWSRCTLACRFVNIEINVIPDAYPVLHCYGTKTVNASNLSLMSIL